MLRIERGLRHLAPDVGTEDERNHDEYLLLGEVEVLRDDQAGVRRDGTRSGFRGLGRRRRRVRRELEWEI